MKIESEGFSLCPVCLSRIPMQRMMKDGNLFLIKECPEHGIFKTAAWNGAPHIEDWGGAFSADPPVNRQTDSSSGCPYDCGICPEHKQQACCVVLEVTSRCNLGCPVCYASSEENAEDPPLDDIIKDIHFLKSQGEPQRPYNLQLSGGEPSMRDDLPLIIGAAAASGFPYIQLNTNGIRLAEDEGYASELFNAGLSVVFLQFDGLEDSVYRKLRGRALFAQKRKAIQNCAEAGLGIVLVPTVVPGVNGGMLGDIIRFGLDNSPAVRGVHFQPVSRFGRFLGITEERRGITVPELICALELQTGGQIKAEDLHPLRSGHPLCSLNGSYRIGPDNRMTAVKPGNGGCSCGKEPEIILSRNYLSGKWGRRIGSGERAGGNRNFCAGDWDSAVSIIKAKSFTISAMFFQDAWNVDPERLRFCRVHVLAGRRLIPFCAYNLTAAGGKPLYRGRRYEDEYKPSGELDTEQDCNGSRQCKPGRLSC